MDGFKIDNQSIYRSKADTIMGKLEIMLVILNTEGSNISDETIENICKFKIQVRDLIEKGLSQ